MTTTPVTLSAASNPRDMHLTLADIDHLFRAPELDPLAGSYCAQSGIDAILNRLKREKLPKNYAMTLIMTVPAHQLTPEKTDALKATLSGYADARISQQMDDLALLNREIRQGLKVGGLFLAACLILAALVNQMSVLPDLGQLLISESLIIAGWVGLWHPMELVLYGWWPHRFRIDLLNHIKAANIQLLPA